jgi:hypothetical protein
VAYELDELLGGGEGIDAVLMTAPSRTDLQGLPERTVAALARPDDGCLVLTTDAPATDAASGLRRATATDADRVGAVDCTRGEASNASPGRLTWRVSGPTNFSRAGTAVDEGLGLLADRGAPRSHLLFDTVSTPLLLGDADAAARFAHYLVGLVAEREGTSVFPAFTNRTDERGLERLKHVADAHVRVRRREGRQELRCAGIADAPREWVGIADSDEPGELGISVR